MAWWWSADEAGFVVAHRSKAVGGHQWGGSAPVTGASTAAVGRLLAADFGVPDQALALVGLLRRTDLAPADALACLAGMLGLAAGIGRATTSSLAAWAAGMPTAVRTPAMTGVPHPRLGLGRAELAREQLPAVGDKDQERGRRSGTRCGRRRDRHGEGPKSRS